MSDRVSRLPWLWVALRRAVVVFAVDRERGGRIVGGSPYGMKILRREGITTAHTAWEHFSRDRETRFAWLEVDGSWRYLRRAA